MFVAGLIQTSMLVVVVLVLVPLDCVMLVLRLWEVRRALQRHAANMCWLKRRCRLKNFFSTLVRLKPVQGQQCCLVLLASTLLR